MLSTERPRVSGLKRSGLGTALELLAFVALVAIWAMTIEQYPELPASIPLHFDASGEPDRFGSKSIAFLLPAISLLMYVSLTVASRFPHRLNFPWPVTEEDARRQYALALEFAFCDEGLGYLHSYLYRLGQARDRDG